ncbi:MAG: helicase-related protein, partial [Pseudomonadota bacterium]|nr:helicase-related protein [Pseudomonadota bacterium]
MIEIILRQGSQTGTGNMISGRKFSKKIIAALGPTNTGKTHYAVEKMLCHSNGMIGLPLRLLAREVYEKVVKRSGKQSVALVTGEERIVPPNPKYWICTVEAMPVRMQLDFLAVDEIQMCADLDRGHVFTERLLKSRGTKETIFLGSNSIRSVLQSVLPDVEVTSKKRLSKLFYVDSRKLSRVPPRSAIVCFSVEEVYSIAELIRREKGGAAIVTGGLSPRTRNSQVQVYQDGEVDYLVATDAIGMGLNLDIKNVAFASLSKFDGFNQRNLFPNELAQIAGRAGRYMSDGTFGVTAGCQDLNLDIIHRIENHIFSDIKMLQWRNSDLCFEDLECLIGSLEQKSKQTNLIKARESIDQRALAVMAATPLVADRVTSKLEVQLLWRICQIPDYRKISLSDHVQILQEIFLLISNHGLIPEEWLEKKIVTLDKYDGGIDGLSQRLAYIRTWNYVSNRGDWLEKPQSLQEKSRLIEDKLSDHLHQLLIEQFVDRRTTILMRKIREKVTLTADLNEKGELFVENQLIGTLEGLIFQLDSLETPHDKKRLLSVSRQAIKSKLSFLVDQLYECPDGDFFLNNSGSVIWRDSTVGTLKSGNTILEPEIEPLIDEMATSTVREKLARRLRYFLDGLIKANLSSLLTLVDDKEISGLSAGLVFRLGESLGIVSRELVSKDVKELDQETRSKFRKHGVRFGQYSVFQPSLLKPEPSRIRILLWKIYHKPALVPEPPVPGLVTIPSVKEVDPSFYIMAGFRMLGTRAVRIDMLERLADLIRNEDAKNG